MPIRLLSTPADWSNYERWIEHHPDGSLWQSAGWKAYQEVLGRDVRIYAEEEGNEIRASALVVIDKTSLGLSTWEVPRGPVVGTRFQELGTRLLEKIVDDAKQEGCLSLYFSPLQKISSSYLLSPSSLRFVHPEATRILDLTLSDDALLAQMKEKGRYNIRLAEKKGVIIKQSNDVDAYALLADETARRDGFTGRGGRAYKTFLETVPDSFLLLAYAPDDLKTPLAGLIGVKWLNVGIYYYGASSGQKRELMAPYLLQWEAMKFCKARGCANYDLFGIAPEGAENHPWSSVSDFKAKFGGAVVSYLPEQEIVLRPFAQMVLQLKRKFL